MEQTEFTPEQVELAIEQIEAEIVKYKTALRRATLASDLKESDIYKELIEPVFFKAYRETSAMNVAGWNIEQTANYVHHIKARAIFSDFIDEEMGMGAGCVDAIEALEDALRKVKAGEDLSEVDTEV